MATRKEAVLLVDIERSIYEVRGHRVMLDEDLARLYRVQTKRLNEQVRRNASRFPSDFMFQLNSAELRDLRSQFATSRSWGGRRTLPFVFTEHGAVMLASVLNSKRAVEMSIHVVKAFVQVRRLMTTQRALARKLAQLDARVGQHDREIAGIVQAIRELMPPDVPRRRRIGF
jgi:hypothetical protein